jgi:hypothetical protein
MSMLFSPTEIRGLILPNPFVRSVTWEGRATAEGACRPALIKALAGEGRHCVVDRKKAGQI